MSFIPETAKRPLGKAVLISHASEERFEVPRWHRDRRIANVGEFKLQEYREYGALLGDHVSHKLRCKILK